MARFPRAVRGYFASEVDALIVRIEGTLGVHDEPVPPITAAELRETRLGVVLHGYDRRAVDGALLEYVRQLEHRERGDADAYVETVSGQVPWLIKWLQDAQFPVTRVRAAYRESEVDGFLDRVLAGLKGEGPAVSGRAVREAIFGGVFLRAGYAEPDVDRFLDELAAALDHLQQVPDAPPAPVTVPAKELRKTDGDTAADGAEPPGAEEGPEPEGAAAGEGDTVRDDGTRTLTTVADDPLRTRADAGPPEPGGQGHPTLKG